MEQAIPSPAPVESSPPAVPAAAPPPAMPAPAMPPPPAAYNAGGQAPEGGGGSVSKFFEGITLSGVVVTSLSILSFFLAIYYYRNKIMQLRDENKNIVSLKAEVDEVKMNVKNAIGDAYQGSSV